MIAGVTTTEYELDMTTEAAAEEPAENATEAAFVTGFGSAKFFMPVPDSGDVVAAHCAWQYRTDEVPNRIPSELTDVANLNTSSLVCVLTRSTQYLQYYIYYLVYISIIFTIMSSFVLFQE